MSIVDDIDRTGWLEDEAAAPVAEPEPDPFLSEVEFDTEAEILIDTLTGEIVTVPGALDAQDGGAEELAEWLGPQIARADARHAGLLAERGAHLKRISEAYDERIKRAEAKCKWLRTQPGFLDCLRAWAEKRLEGKRQRSTQVGLLTLAFHKAGGKIVLEDGAAALEWARDAAPEAVAVSERFLISKLPAGIDESVRAGLVPGIVWQDPYDKFSIK